MAYISFDGQPFEPERRFVPTRSRQRLERTYFLHAIHYRRKPYQKRAIHLLEKGLDRVDSKRLKSGEYYLDKAIAACVDARFDCIRNVAEIYRDAAIAGMTIQESSAGALSKPELDLALETAIQDVLWFSNFYRVPGKCTI